MKLQLTELFQFAAADGYSRRNPITDGYSAIDGYTVGSSFVSAPLFLGRVMFYCAVVSTTDGSGTVKLQGCVDEAAIDDDKPDPALKHWFDLSFQQTDGSFAVSQTISGASELPFEEVACGYRWVRLVYTKTSGNCTMTARVQVKGIS